MRIFIVTLAEDPSQPTARYKYVSSVNGISVAQHASVPVALLAAAMPAKAQVVALVPAHRLSWHAVQLPQGTLKQGYVQANPRLRDVLDGLLEDRLLDEPALLHVALEPQARTNTPVWVAVCNRQWLQSGLQALAQAGLEVARVVPAYAPEAGTDAAAFLQRLEDQTNQAGSTEQHDAQQALNAARTTWNLAQFGLLKTRRGRLWQFLFSRLRYFLTAPTWRLTRLGLCALLLLNLVGLNAWAWQERAQLNQQRGAIAAILKTTFPQTVVVDAPLQMAKEVALLQQASGALASSDLEAMLNTLGAALPTTAKLEALEFSPGELRFKGVTLDPPTKAALSLALSGRGYRLSEEGNQWLLKPVQEGQTP